MFGAIAGNIYLFTIAWRNNMIANWKEYAVYHNMNMVWSLFNTRKVRESVYDI